MAQDQKQGHPAEPYQTEDEIDLLALVGILWRYKKLILLITGIAALGILGFSVLSLLLPPEISPLPNEYTANALILIRDESGGGLSSMLSSSGLGDLASLAGISSGGSSYGELAVKLLKSRSILDTVAREFELTKRYDIKEHVKTATRKKMLEYLAVNNDTDTKTVEIKYTDIDPLFAQSVTNRFVELLDSRFASIGTNRNLNQKQLLEEKLSDVKVEISTLETKIQDFQKKYGILTVESLATEQVTIMAELRSQLIMKEMEIKTYSDFSRIEDPVLLRIKAERNNLRELIKEMETGFSKYDDILPPQTDLPHIALQFTHLKRDLLVQSKIFEILTQQYELTKLAVEGEPPIFQVLELAEAPDKKSGPSRMMLSIVVVIAAFFVSILTVFIINTVKTIRNDPERMGKLRGQDSVEKQRG